MTILVQCWVQHAPWDGFRTVLSRVRHLLGVAAGLSEVMRLLQQSNGSLYMRILNLGKAQLVTGTKVCL